MQPEHRLKGVKQNSNINKLLSLRPNPDMSAYDFLYKIATLLMIDNNVYIYVQRSPLGDIVGFYPIKYTEAELKKDAKTGDLILDFTFRQGQRATAFVDDVIVLRRHFINNDFFGENNRNPLYVVVNLLHSISQSIINAIKNSAIIRGILRVIGSLNDDDSKAQKERFEKNFLDAANGSGIIVSDDSSDFVSLDGKANPVIIDEKQSEFVKKKIYNYFGISENIINGKYTDEEWNAFYEGTIEPLALQLSQEMSYKIFTENELNHGNEIILSGNRLSYMSTSSKVKMFEAIKELGVVSKGQIATIFNLPTPPDPDEYLQSLNYINSKIANDYQLNNNGDKNETCKDIQ